MIKLYSTCCPKCLMVERLLNNDGIDYELVTDIFEVETMAEMSGIHEVPFAVVGEEVLNFHEIMNRIKNGELYDVPECESCNLDNYED